MNYFARRVSSEDGAVAVMVAIMFVALMSVSMLAIDGGNLWSSRRNLITDTDAAALAGASVLANGACAADDITKARQAAEDILEANDASSVLVGEVVVSCSDGSGRVEVSAERTTTLAFAGTLGLSSVDVTSSSIAQFGQITTVRGLRPVALCSQDSHFSESDEGEHPSTYGSELVHRITFSKTSACGDSSGNWGWLSFDSRKSTSSWAEFGYDQPVTVGLGVADCAPNDADETRCMSRPGALGASMDRALATLTCPSNLSENQCIAQGFAFPMLLFDVVSGNGSNAGYHPFGFVGVILRGWERVTGNGGYFDLQFVDQIITNGTITPGPAGAGPGLIGIQLCGGAYGSTEDDYCSIEE